MIRTSLAALESNSTACLDRVGSNFIASKGDGCDSHVDGGGPSWDGG